MSLVRDDLCYGGGLVSFQQGWDSVAELAVELRESKLDRRRRLAIAAILLPPCGGQCRKIPCAGRPGSSPDHVAAWEPETTGEFRPHVLAGNHFFMYLEQALWDAIAADLFELDMPAVSHLRQADGRPGYPMRSARGRYR